MAQFPNTFAESAQYLPGDIGEQGNEALDMLAGEGYVVLAGVTRYLGGAISAMASQRHIREYCPKDATTQRFGTQKSMEQWLQKGGGRGMFLLARMLGEPGDKPLSDKNVRPVGYGWEGAELSDEVLGGETTFALRLGEEGLGQGLAAPFTKAIVAGAAALYGAEGVWLETWKSNHAGHIYRRAGFEHVSEVPGQERPTADGRLTFDTRVFMQYPDELLPTFGLNDE